MIVTRARSMDLTQIIGATPFFKETPRKLSGWDTFWISTTFWSILFVLTCGLAWTSLKLGSVSVKKLVESHVKISAMTEAHTKAVAERDAKITRLMTAQSVTASDLVVLAKVMQEICSTVQNKEQAQFINAALPEAMRIQVTEGIPASAVLAMSIYESYYGQSRLAKEFNNFFGMKAFDNWTGPKAVGMPTRDNGVPTLANFRAYPDLSAGFDGYAQFLKDAGRYDRAFHSKTGLEFVGIVLHAGYCKDSTYLDAIRQIIERHKLDKLDKFYADRLFKDKPAQEKALATSETTALLLQ